MWEIYAFLIFMTLDDIGVALLEKSRKNKFFRLSKTKIKKYIFVRDHF